MKRTAHLLLAAGLVLTSTASGAPYIAHVTDAGPGQTMVVSGGEFNPDTVRVVVHVPGNKTSERETLPQRIRAWSTTYTGNPSKIPAKPPADKTHTLKPIHTTPRSVFATLPASPYPPGYVAVVWLQDGELLSAPFVVNRPRAWFLLKPTCRPGEMNRLCGINLRGDRFVPRYLFLRKKGGAPRLLDEMKRHKEDGFSEPFCCQFRLPADLDPGSYDVFMHSNSGGELGFTRPLPLTVTDAPAFPEELFTATQHGVEGNSVTDNTKPLQALVDQAGETGGGIVFLPPGSYRVDDTVQLREHVILRGAGRDATTVFFGGAPSDKKRQRWLISARGVHRTGLEDLTVRVAHPFEYAVSYYDSGRPTFDTHIRRCRIVGGTVGIHYNVRMEVADCLFEDSRFFAHNLKWGWVHNNQFTTGRLQGNPVAFWSTENSTIEHNRAHGSNRGFVWQNHGMLGHYHNLVDANAVEAARFGGNAGETYLFEGSGFQWMGAPTKLLPSGFAVDGAGWKTNQLQNAFAVVVAGHGLGQYRRIAANTATTVTLVDGWRVPPGDDARISILRGVVENAICNNRHVNCDNSMMFYGCGILNNRIIRNRSENTLGISVWSRGDAEKGVLIPDYYNIFDGNVCEDQGGFRLTRMGDLKQVTAVRNLNNVFRNSFLADVRRKRENQYHNVWEETRHGSYRPVQAAFWCDIGRSYHKDRSQSPIWVDTLIERSFITRCKRGVELRAIAGGTVVHANTFYDVEQPVLDKGTATVLLKNRIELAREIESP